MFDHTLPLLCCWQPFATCLLVSLKRGITAVQCTVVLTAFILC